MPGRETQLLQSLVQLNRRIDDLVEQAQRERLSLPDAMARILPALCDATGAEGAFLHTFDEDLALTLLRYPEDLEVPSVDAILTATSEPEPTAYRHIGEGAMVVAQPLDVAGAWFGAAGLVIPLSSPLGTRPDELMALLDVACEELDNFLCSIREAREKHRIIMQISEALRHRVLGEGLREAVAALCSGVSVERLLLVCVAEDRQLPTLHFQLYEGCALSIDTMGLLAPHAEDVDLRCQAHALLVAGDRALLDRFGFRGALEEVLINGIVEATVVGKIFVMSRSGGFNTYDRDLLAGFAGFVRQRVIDFNKEWRTLARSFRASDVARLLRENDYVTRCLAPREENVAMLYADIAGFTRLSETILRTPSAVAALVEAWSREAVSLVWEHGGVFDKMVGDCVIALFGPPFYEAAPGDRLLAAIRCARAIREMTNSIPSRPGFAQLLETGLSVSTGVNLAPLFVGRFGPDDAFTGFSSGMNNTARLQGCAHADEILVMSSGLEQLPPNHGLVLGEERSAQAKNVAEPLRFRPLVDGTKQP